MQRAGTTAMVLVAMSGMCVWSAQESPEAARPGWRTFDAGFREAGWRPVCGQWRRDERQYVQEDAGANPAYCFLPGAAVSDFEFSVRLRAEAVGRAMNAALVFRSTDSGHFYYAQVGVKHRQIVLARADPHKQWHEITRKTELDLAAGRWHDVRVAAVGARIRIFLDGTCVIDARDSTLASGCVGLRTGLARVRFAEPRLVGKAVVWEKGWRIVNTDWVPEDLPKLRGGERAIAVSGEVGSGMFPKLLQLPDGELVAFVRGGAPHIGAGGRIDLIRSRDGGRSWSEPAALPKTSEDDRGPSVGLAPDGTLVCMYRVYDAYDEDGKRREGTPRQLTMLTRSGDRGVTWSAPTRVAWDGYDYVAPFQRMICLDDGTMLMPAYDARKAVVVRSRDNGRTWRDVTVVAEGFNEHALLCLPDGRILTALRAKQGGLWTSVSAGRGATWSEPRQVTDGMLHPADLLVLPSGNMLLVYGRRHPPYGVECRLSIDWGKTWGQRQLLAWTATNTDCGYPSAVVLDDGTIVMLWYAIGSTEDATLAWHCEVVRFRGEHILAGFE